MSNVKIRFCNVAASKNWFFTKFCKVAALQTPDLFLLELQVVSPVLLVPVVPLPLLLLPLLPVPPPFVTGK